MLSNLPDGMDGTPAIERARAALTLAADRADPAELLALREAVAAAPDDHQARFDLAVAEMAEGNRDGVGEVLPGAPQDPGAGCGPCATWRRMNFT